MKISIFTAVLALFFQAAALDLRLSRDWGYGGFNNDIQGRFSMHVEAPDDLVEVRFRIDAAVVSVDTEAPFRYQFETDDYPPGIHTLSATGTLASGEEIASQELVREFLSAEAAASKVQDVVLPILVVLGAVMVLGIGLPLLFGRRQRHKPGVYGAAGGAVCKRCGMPFSRSLLAPNMLLGKLERCPHCGKWAIVRRASPADLEAAEARLAGEGEIEGVTTETEEEKRQRLLDESRFDN